MKGKLFDWTVTLLAVTLLIVVCLAYMPSHAEFPEIPAVATGGRGIAFRDGRALIDINTADVELLMSLQGIGRTLAERIVAYREEYGPFSSVDAIIDVSGIGEKTLEGFRDHICVGER